MGEMGEVVETGERLERGALRSSGRRTGGGGYGLDRG